MHGNHQYINNQRMFEGMRGKPELAHAFAPACPTYEQSRRAIKNLLKITEDSLDAADELPEEEPRSGWFMESLEEDVVKVEEPEVVELHPREVKRMNKNNQELAISLDLTQSISRSQESEFALERPQVEANAAAGPEEGQENVNGSKSIINPLASQAIFDYEGIQKQQDCYDYDASFVTHVSMLQNKFTSSSPTFSEIQRQVLPEEQQLITHCPCTETSNPVRRLLGITERSDFSSQKAGKEVKQPQPKVEKREVIDLDGGSPSPIIIQDSRRFQSILLQGRPSSHFDFGFSRPAQEARRPQIYSFACYKKSMKKRIKQTMKEFTRTISVIDRRNITGKSNGLYEYWWQFGEVSCWKALHQHESLFDLYLCQAKSQNAAVLKYMPSDFTSDLPYLIYKIEVCPTIRLEEQEDDIERTLFNHMLAAEVVKYFHETLLFKALEFNRRCDYQARLPSICQSARHPFLAEQPRPQRNRTIFIDLEEQAEQKSSPVELKIKTGLKKEISSLHLSHASFSHLKKAQK